MVQSSTDRWRDNSRANKCLFLQQERVINLRSYQAGHSKAQEKTLYEFFDEKKPSKMIKTLTLKNLTFFGSLWSLDFFLGQNDTGFVGRHFCFLKICIFTGNRVLLYIKIRWSVDQKIVKLNKVKNLLKIGSKSTFSKPYFRFVSFPDPAPQKMATYPNSSPGKSHFILY